MAASTVSSIRVVALWSKYAGSIRIICKLRKDSMINLMNVFMVPSVYFMSFRTPGCYGMFFLEFPDIE